MRAKIVVSGIDTAEKAANEILEHIEAIKRLQQDAAWKSADVEIHLINEEHISDN